MALAYRTATDVFGLTRTARLDDLWRQCAVEVLGASEEVLQQEWRRATLADGTNYGRMSSSHGELVNRWHETFDTNELYRDLRLVWPFAACSVYQSSETITNAIKRLVKNEAKITRVLDWGAGCGLTTSLIAANFPNALVHHLDPMVQHKAAASWFAARARVNNLQIVDQPEGEYDLVVALEMLYVFPKPGCARVGTLDPWWSLLSEHTTPDAWAVEHTVWSAEARGYTTTGFFEHYDIDGQFVLTRRVKGKFRSAMRSRKWFINWEGWNGSPALWRHSTR